MYIVKEIFNAHGIIVIKSVLPHVPRVWTSQSPLSFIADGSQYSFKLKYNITFLEVNSKERKDSVIFKQDECFHLALWLTNSNLDYVAYPRHYLYHQFQRQKLCSGGKNQFRLS